MKDDTPKPVQMNEHEDMPIGLKMSMVMNPEARDQFMHLTRGERDHVENLARQADSKHEMAEIVDELEEGKLD